MAGPAGIAQRLRARDERAAIADDGREIRLTFYAGAEAKASITLKPVYALAIASKLLDAARAGRLASPAPFPSALIGLLLARAVPRRFWPGRRRARNFGRVVSVVW